MREWTTEGSIEADTRYSRTLKWAFRQFWIPGWMLDLVWRFCG